MNSLGEYLRKHRGDLSLRQFAEVCDISHTHLDSIEKGIDPRTKKPVRITTETLKRIAERLGEDYLYLAALAEESEYALDGDRQLEKSPVYDNEALELMEEMHKRPELKVLFSTTKGAKKSDIELVNEMLKRMAGESGYETD